MNARAALVVFLCTSTSCVGLDGFFFNPRRTEQYTLPYRDGFWPMDPRVPEELREVLALRDENGTVIAYAVFARQPGDAMARAPTVLYHHGNAENIDRYWERVNHIWALGANVLVYDYPGYGRSPGTPTEEGIYRTARAALAYLYSLGTAIDSSRIFHYGFSLGSAPATELASRQPCRGLILEAPFTSVAGLAADGSLVVPRSFVMTNRFDNRSKIRDAARLASSNAPRERTVVLIFHGTEDDFVQTKYGEQLADEVRRHPPAGNVRLELIPGARHGDVPLVGDRMDGRYSRVLREFLFQP